VTRALCEHCNPFGGYHAVGESQAFSLPGTVTLLAAPLGTACTFLLDSVQLLVDGISCLRRQFGVGHWMLSAVAASTMNRGHEQQPRVPLRNQFFPLLLLARICRRSSVL
jgi:hypothetical protein